MQDGPDDAQARERALRENQARLELALRASGIGVWVYTVATGLLDLDDTVREIFGTVRARRTGCSGPRRDLARSRVMVSDSMMAPGSATKTMEPRGVCRLRTTRSG